MSSGRAARRKGHDFERLVVNLLSALGKEGAERNLEYQSARAGHDVHYYATDTERRTISCKCGNQVPVTVYNWVLSTWRETDSCKDVPIAAVNHRLCLLEYRAGNAWITKALGRCDELWCKRPGWPIVVVSK